MCGVILPGLAKTWPLSTSSFLVPRSKIPALSPARPSSNCLLNISIPVTTVFWVSRKPTISTSPFNLTSPLSILPVTTVPRPSIEKISSIGIKNGFSVSRVGSGICSSKALSNSIIGFWASASFGFSIAFKAEPLIIGISSPGNSYFLSKSFTSSSTKSINSGSLTWSILFKKTTIAGTPTWRAKRICSLV